MLLLGRVTPVFSARSARTFRKMRIVAQCGGSRRTFVGELSGALATKHLGIWGFCAHSLWLEVICVRLRLCEKDAGIDRIRSQKSGPLEISRYKFSRPIMKFGDYQGRKQEYNSSII